MNLRIKPNVINVPGAAEMIRACSQWFAGRAKLAEIMRRHGLTPPRLAA